MMTQVVLAGLFYQVGDMQHRFVVMNGNETVVVGRYYWERARIYGECASVVIKRYPKKHIVVHICKSYLSH